MAELAREEIEALQCRHCTPAAEFSLLHLNISSILPRAGDPEMAELAREEIEALQAGLEEQGERLKIMLLPKDPLDERNIMLEVLLRTLCMFCMLCCAVLEMLRCGRGAAAPGGRLRVSPWRQCKRRAAALAWGLGLGWRVGMGMGVHGRGHGHGRGSYTIRLGSSLAGAGLQTRLLSHMCRRQR